MQSALYLQKLQAKFANVSRAGRLAALLLLVLPVVLIVQILSDAECAEQDVTIRGLRIFTWAKNFIPGKALTAVDLQLRPHLALFAHGIDSINPSYVTQGAVYDCRFLATISSFARSQRGRDCIPKMIRQDASGDYIVSFPGMQSEPVKVGPLSNLEVKLYAHALSSRGSEGIWLPVIEKAYGQYRINQQSIGEKVFRFFRHGLLEWRWTSNPALLGYGASYGAKDDQAVALLTGNHVASLPTWGYELGEFGLGKGYVTVRQLRSWINRSAVIEEMLSEQSAKLTEAMRQGYIVTACTETAASEAQGIRSNHAFAVIDYDAKHQLLLVRDVVGSNFYITLSQFNRYFSDLNIEQRS